MGFGHKAIIYIECFPAHTLTIMESKMAKIIVIAKTMVTEQKEENDKHEPSVLELHPPLLCLEWFQVYSFTRAPFHNMVNFDKWLRPL